MPSAEFGDCASEEDRVEVGAVEDEVEVGSSTGKDVAVAESAESDGFGNVVPVFSTTVATSPDAAVAVAVAARALAVVVASCATAVNVAGDSVAVGETGVGVFVTGNSVPVAMGVLVNVAAGVSVVAGGGAGGFLVGVRVGIVQLGRP